MKRSNKLVPEHILSERQNQREQERENLVIQTVKLANGATFTRLKPVRSA